MRRKNFLIKSKNRHLANREQNIFPKKNIQDRITPHITNFSRLRLSIEKQEGKRKYKSDGGVMVGEFVCVCVDHLQRCKTSFRLFCAFVVGSTRFSSLYAGGWSVLQMSPSNEDASVVQWYGLGTLNPRTCSIFFISVNSNRPSQEPACRFVFNFISAQLPQSAFSMTFMTDKAASKPSSEQGRKKHSSNWTSRWIN